VCSYVLIATENIITIKFTITLNTIGPAKQLNKNMKKELQEELYKNYPKIFKNSKKSMQESCMFWGIECDSGWYNILDQLCYAMSNTYSTGIRLDRKTAQRIGVEASTYKNVNPTWWWPGDKRPRLVVNGKSVAKPGYRPQLKEIFTYPFVYGVKKLAYLLRPTETFYSLKVNPPQVVADQVKEKFGTLRFYYHLEFDPTFQELAYGKNPNPEARKVADRYQAYFDGMVNMAENMSARTCEETGLPGEMHVSGGWYRTLNREHAKTNESCASRNYTPTSELTKEDSI